MLRTYRWRSVPCEVSDQERGSIFDIDSEDAHHSGMHQAGKAFAREDHRHVRRIRRVVYACRTWTRLRFTPGVGGVTPCVISTCAGRQL